VVGLLDEGQEFQRMQGEDARSTAAEVELDIDVLYAENNAVIQIQQLYQVVHAPKNRRPSVVLVETVAGEGLERLARAAVRAGIGWILINRRVPYLDELRRKHPGVPIGTIGTDHLEIGRIQGRQFQALVPGGGQIVYVQGPADTSAAQERLAGAEEVCGRGIDLKMVEASGPRRAANRPSPNGSRSGSSRPRGRAWSAARTMRWLGERDGLSRRPPPSSPASRGSRSPAWMGCPTADGFRWTREHWRPP
jgi:hypothetical protein